MGLTIADSYYLKAKDAASGFCGDWEEACEALNYALSYDENHSPSLCLLGEIYARNLSMPDKAFACFDKVIANNQDFKNVYITYARYLIAYQELERATKLADFAATIKTVSKAEVLWVRAAIEEKKEHYKKARSYLKQAKLHAYNYDYFSFIENEVSRIKKKIKLSKKPKKKVKKKSKKNRKKSKNKKKK